MTPTVHLRFVKRRVGRNVVRILQQKWEERALAEDGIFMKNEWRDVEMADEATPATFYSDVD